jgi:hypothetical protein
MAGINETAPHGYLACGTTDEITDCDHCGKTGLKSTVILRFLDAEGNADDGERYVGVVCAGKMLSGGKANPRLATKILREAQAADRKRADAVEFSREMMAFFDAAGHRMNEKLDAYVAANVRLQSLSLLEQLKETAESIARHTEVIATNGAAALS